MHWTTHVLTGAAAGYLIERPALAAAAGVAGHIALDTFPHHDPEGEVPYVLDSLAGAALMAAMALSRTVRDADPTRASLWGAVAAGLPDLELLRKLVSPVEPEEYVFPTHNGTIPHRQTGALCSGLSQCALVAALAVPALLKLRRRLHGRNGPVKPA